MPKAHVRTLAGMLFSSALMLAIAMPSGAQEPAPPAPQSRRKTSSMAPLDGESAPESVEERSLRLIGEAEARRGGMARRGGGG
jgi:hypothetical protein